MKKLYRFSVDFSRGGIVEGTFVANDAMIKMIIGKYIYFGEILGKHSSVDFEIEENMFTTLTDDQDFIEKFQKLECESGYDPFDYLDEDDEDYDEIFALAED